MGYLTNDVINSSIDLVVQSSTLTPIYPLTWTGLSNGVPVSAWDITNTPDWTAATPIGPLTYQFRNTSPVTFDDTASGSTTVNLTTTLAPSSIVVSNNAKAYVFAGSGAISGLTGLVKTNSGTLTLTETGGDNFTGGINVGGGTLILSNVNANIGGGIAVTTASLIDKHSGSITNGLTLASATALLDQSGTITGDSMVDGSSLLQIGNNDALGSLPAGTLNNNGTVVFNRSDATLVVNSPISGGGVITNAGIGTVTIAVTQPFTGNIVANAGTLIIATGNVGYPNGIAKASLIINNGATVVAGMTIP